MLERFLDQIGEVLRLCEDTDGILVVNREGIIEYHRIPLNSYWCSQDTVGRHILERYPELDGESSTILTALRTGRASYNVLQDINNHRGERVLLESTTIPIVVDGRVEERFVTLVNPGRQLGERITVLTGITDDMVKDAPAIEDMIGDVVRFCGNLPLLGHNILLSLIHI